MNPLRAAIIGLGIGRRHITAFREAGCEVVAIVGYDESKTEKARQEFGVPFACTDYRDLLIRDDIDLVSICTPDRLHAEQAIAALEAGKHVLVEKPLATTLEDAARIVAKAREVDKICAVGHNYRFIPQFARAKELVAAGALGELFMGESSYIQDLYFMEGTSPDYWRLRDPQDFFLGGAIHNVDLLRWIVGEVVEVQAYANHMMPFYPLPDNYVANLCFAGGRIGRVLLVLGSRLKDKFLVELALYGAEGTLRTTMQRNEIVLNRGRAEGTQPECLALPEANSFALEIAQFVECVRNGQTPLVDAAEGARTVAVCEAAVRSAREGKPVLLDYSPLQ